MGWENSARGVVSGGGLREEGKEEGWGSIGLWEWGRWILGGVF